MGPVKGQPEDLRCPTFGTDSKNAVRSSTHGSRTAQMGFRTLRMTGAQPGDRIINYLERYPSCPQRISKQSG